MMRCRICGATKNLIYTPAEIFVKNKRLPLPLKEIASANGNICRFCELRLENFHKEESPTEIDITDDERYCEMFYKRHYGHAATATAATVDATANGTMPPQLLGSNGGDLEVIEVLTSRETTPDKNGLATTTIQPPIVMPNLLNSNPRIIDVIDLEDDDEDDVNVDADEDADVDIGAPVDLNKTAPILEEAKPFIPIARQENLLGCLNLVTSDSETEESEINFEPCQQTTTTLLPATPPSSSMSSSSISTEKLSKSISPTNFPVCEVCGIRFLDTASQLVHMRDNHQLPCPVCASQYKTNLELIYHIRQKHREYNGEKLNEGAKCPQDSAMTIRLRYEQSATYYECQLCGNIDIQFKAHKQHIIENHPHESKSLRDPMMKTKQNCPACHQKFGIHPVDVCRHLLVKHPEKCYKYLKEVNKELKSLPIKKAEHVQKVKDSARILSFIGKDEYFFECKLCKRLFGNVRCFLTHLNSHNIQEWADLKQLEQDTANKKLNGSFDSNQRLKRKTDEHKVVIGLNEKQMILPKKNNNNNNNNNDKKILNQHCEKLLKMKPPPPPPPQPVAALKKLIPPKEAAYSKAKNKIDSIKKLNKEKATTTTAAEVAAKNDLKKQKKLKRRSKNDLTVNKVKVKAPLKRFPTQKYICKHCQKLFKGFRNLNLHLMQTHAEEEFHNCTVCLQQFFNATALAAHTASLHQNTKAEKLEISKRKRKFIAAPANLKATFDENFNSEPASKRIKLSDKTENSNNKNVVGSSKKLKNTTADQMLRSARKVCPYCGRLFAKSYEFVAHEKSHTKSKDKPWIAWTALLED